jgi:hypothetical protein
MKHINTLVPPLGAPLQVADQPLYVGLLCCVAALIPSDAIAVGKTSGATIYLSEIIIWVATSAILLSEYAIYSRDVFRRSFRSLQPLYFYVLWCSLVALIAYSLRNSGDIVGKVKNLLPGVLLAVVVVHVVRSQNSLNRLVTYMVIGLAANAIAGLFQILAHAPYFVPPHVDNVWKTDLHGNYLEKTANGFFITMNNFGTALLPGIILLFSLLRNSFISNDVNAKRNTIAYIIVFFILAIALFFSYQKGAYVWTAIGFLTVLCPPRFRFLWTITSLAVVISALSAYGVEAYPDVRDTLVMRFKLWTAAGQVISADPSILIIGDGLKQMAHWGSVFARSPMSTSHNTWLDQILLYGIAGFFMYLWIWAAALWRSFAGSMRFGGPARAMLVGLHAALGALAGAIFLEPRADGVYPVAQIFLIVGLIQAQLNVAKGPDESNRHRRQTRIASQHLLSDRHGPVNADLPSNNPSTG